MEGFFNALSAFWSSDLAKDYKCIILGLMIFLIAMTAFIVSVLFNKIILPYKLNEAGYIVPNYQNALAELKELREENAKLKSELNKYRNMKRMSAAIESEDLTEEADKALNIFLKNSKTN